MPKRKRKDDKKVRSPGDEVEAAVRAAAESIAAGHRGDGLPAADVLAANRDFIRASERLVDSRVPFETVEQLARASNGIVNAIACRATALRDDVSAGWLDWAYRELHNVYSGALFFLLESIERHGEAPFIARVLARADDDWSYGRPLDVVRAFVERRVRAGERATASEFDQFVAGSDEETVAAVVTELEGTLPQETVQEFKQWRRRKAQRKLFESIGRMWESRPDEPTLLTVGGRADVVDALRRGLRASGNRCALVVGEHGVGKSAVIREALRPFHDGGFVIFEAGAADVQAGKSYI